MARPRLDSEEPRSHHLELVQRFYEDMWNRFDTGVFPELLEPDITFRGSLGQEKCGYSGLAEYVAFIQSAFPDFHNQVLDVVADETRAFARLLYSGTHQGEVFGIQPTGKRFEYSGAALFTFRDGRISDVWVLGDIYGLMQKLQGCRRIWSRFRQPQGIGEVAVSVVRLALRTGHVGSERLDSLTCPSEIAASVC